MQWSHQVGRPKNTYKNIEGTKVSKEEEDRKIKNM